VEAGTADVIRCPRRGPALQVGSSGRERCVQVAACAADCSGFSGRGIFFKSDVRFQDGISIILVKAGTSQATTAARFAAELNRKQFLRMCKTYKARLVSLALLVVATLTITSSTGFAQTGFRPGVYHRIPGVGNYNPTTRSFHVPGQSVFKPTGRYDHVGNGYYRNPVTGNLYNPQTGSYTRGRNLTFRPGNYHNLGDGTRYNPTTDSLHIPGQAVVKPSGVYLHTRNGYYRNPVTGNVYNPHTGAYKY